MIVTKKSSIPSISLVFGEAQQVSSSQTAAEKLPQILRKANISPTLSSTSEAQSEQSLEEMPAPAPLNQSTNAHEVEQPEAPTTHDQCISPLAAEGTLSYLHAFSLSNVLYHFQVHILILRLDRLTRAT
jgi:hypothetical protein